MTSNVQSKIEQMAASIALLVQVRNFMDANQYDWNADDTQGEDYSYASVWASGSSLQFDLYGPNAKAMMRELRQILGGKWNKQDADQSFVLYQSHPTGVYLRISASRTAICERRVTGQREVVVEAVPAKPFVPKHTVTEDIVEWDCGNLLTD